MRRFFARSFLQPGVFVAQKVLDEFDPSWDSAKKRVRPIHKKSGVTNRLDLLFNSNVYPFSLLLILLHICESFITRPYNACGCGTYEYSGRARQPGLVWRR